MDEDIPLPFDLPAVARKKVSTAFDGGRITSDGGIMLLAQAQGERSPSCGDRKFESLSLQRRVRLSPGAAFEGREPGFPRGCARWLGDRVGRDAQGVSR